MSYPIPNDTVRPVISLSHIDDDMVSIEPMVMHNKARCKVVLRRDIISIGCTDITPNAAKFILEKYNKEFPPLPKEVII